MSHQLMSTKLFFGKSIVHNYILCYLHTLFFVQGEREIKTEYKINFILINTISFQNDYS